jgi:hypothetical protein
MKKIIQRAAGVGALLALLPLSLVAQTPEQRIERSFARAQQVGVPVQLLESKVAEGRAKGVRMDLIAQVVERRQASLEQVQASVGERYRLTPQELGLSADAVQAGVSEAVLAAISERAPGDRRAVAIAALAQLVQAGHPSEVALERVTQALQQGPEALMNLPAQAQAGRGGPPEGIPGQGPGAQNGRGGPPASVPAAGAAGRGRGRGGPDGG